MAIERPPASDAALVQDVVRNAHSDLTARTLLTRKPQLVNACWDWGGEAATEVVAYL